MGALREPASADTGVPPTSAGVAEWRAFRDEVVSGLELAPDEALASRAASVPAPVAPTPPAAASVTPEITPPPAAAVAPATTPLTDTVTSPTDSTPDASPPVTVVEPSRRAVVPDRRAPVADLPKSLAVASPAAEPAPLALRLESPTGSAVPTQSGGRNLPRF